MKRCILGLLAVVGLLAFVDCATAQTTTTPTCPPRPTTGNFNHRFGFNPFGFGRVVVVPQVIPQVIAPSAAFGFGGYGFAPQFAAAPPVCQTCPQVVQQPLVPQQITAAPPMVGFAATGGSCCNTGIVPPGLAFGGGFNAGLGYGGLGFNAGLGGGILGGGGLFGNVLSLINPLGFNRNFHFHRRR